MSLGKTFRQKLIRVSCSAAVCGLSLSFLFAQAVQRESARLGSWVAAPTILPVDYLPLRPIALTWERLQSSTQWSEKLVAINLAPVALPLPPAAALPVVLTA